MTRFKICCIKNVNEMRLAVSAGASAIGLVSAMPSGPGPISEKQIEEIATVTPPGVSTFLLTSLQDAQDIIEQQRRCKTDTIQIVDELKNGTYQQIKRALPGVKVVQVIHVINDDSVAEAQVVASYVDALLLDSGKPDAEVKELGGTGRVHDWNLSKKIVESIPIPVFLAGGLNPENVARAIHEVQPYAVDICSALRTDDNLDESKLATFASNLKATQIS